MVDKSKVHIRLRTNYWLLRSRVRYGTADFLYNVVLARGSTNFCVVLARLGWLFAATVKISLWRDLVAVERANFLQSWVRLASSRSKPRSRSCSVRERAQYLLQVPAPGTWPGPGSAQSATPGRPSPCGPCPPPSSTPPVLSGPPPGTSSS